MPFVEENPAVADSVADSQSEDEMSYEEMCEESLENAEMFRRGRRAACSIVGGEVALGPADKAVDEAAVRSLLGLVLAQPLSARGQSFRLSVTVKLEEAVDGSDDVYGEVRCKATECYDDGVIFKTVLPEGRVERCSVITAGCSYRQGDVVYPFSVEEQAFVPPVRSQPEVVEGPPEEVETFDSLCVVR